MAEKILVDFPTMRSARYFPSLEALLGDSTARFLDDVYADPDLDLTRFRYLFARVLNAYPDPPFEAVWFFSALVFHDAPDDFRLILRILSAYTASSPAAAKPLALLAPVVSELFRSAKPRRKIEALVEAVFKYIGICSSRPAGGKVNADGEMLLPGFGELVKVWCVRNSRDSCPFQVLFPLVRDEARQKLKKDGCSVDFLAGVVVAEAFLLRLCLMVQGVAGVSPSEVQTKLRIWAANSILVFKNQQFFEVLQNMLENPPLPVYSPLSADDEILVRDVLYDALILVDYSVQSGAEVDKADSSLLPIDVSRLAITVGAINDARCKGDQGRALLYINAFSTSKIAFYLTSWARQAATDQLGKPIAVTSEAFLKRLVDHEDKGLKVFGENCSRIKERLMHDEGKNDNRSRISQSDADRFFIDKQSHQEGMDTKGGEEMETADNAFMAAAHSMKVMAIGTRKMKDCGTEDNSVKDYLQATIGMSSCSEVENPV